METKPKAHRGFAAMTLEKRTAIAKRGGAGVAAANRSFAKNADLARAAGQRGGAISAAKRAAKKLAKEQHNDR